MNSRWRAPLSSLVVLVALAAASPAPGDDEHLRIPSETTVTYVGSNYWLRAKLPENWAYGRSPLEDGLQLAISRDPETGGISSDLITFTEKQALDDWPAHHEASWAADAYRNWEVDFMQSQGVDAGLYELHDIEMGAALIGSKTLYTMTYRQVVPDPDDTDIVIHAHLYLYFPDAYADEGRFYWIHYEHLCEHGEQEQLLLDIVDNLLSSLSTAMDEAPRQSSISWSSIDGTYVAINALGDNRTYYFSNDAERRCFSYSLDGIWATMNRPGYFVGPNGLDLVTVELVGAYELTGFSGRNLVERVINGQREMLQLDAAGEVKVIDVQTVDGVFPGARKATYQIPLDALGRAVTTTSAWYVAGVATGWAALVQTRREMNIGDDDLARDVFASIRLTRRPGCFRDEVDALLR